MSAGSRLAMRAGLALLALVHGYVFAAAGRTATAFEVSPTGEATYTVPIFAPAGIRNLAPQLAFSYSHRAGAGNAWLGAGWDIAGLTAIARCPKTWAQDGVSVGVQLDATDRFCLDGQQLKLFNGTYGADGAEYRTEIESFARIRSYGVAGTGPAYFVVEHKDGTVTEYGTRADSRIEALGSATVRVWSVSTARDRNDNRIEYNYTEDTTYGSFRIANVQYTTNPTQGLTTAPYTIVFTYETQPVTEIQSGYQGGKLVKDVIRLTRVDVNHAGSTLQRRYTVAYESTLSSASRSRVASITECAGSSGTDCLPATTFSYQNGTNAYTASTATPNYALQNTRSMVLDVNGDGRSDLVYPSSATQGAGTWMIAFANANGGYNTAFSSGVSNAMYWYAIPIDYDADGLGDLLVPYNNSTWWFIKGTTSGFAAAVNTGVSAVGAVEARALDVNGDGLEDLVWNTGTQLWYRLRVWGGTFSSTASLLADPGATILLEGGSGRNHGMAPDFNGDGHADLILTTSYEWPFGGYIYLTEAILCGTSNVMFLGSFSSPNGLVTGDFNADRYSDIAIPMGTGGQWTYRFSTGMDMTAEYSGASYIAQNTYYAIVTDWDSDGYSDILVPGTDGIWKVIRSSGEQLSTVISTGVSVGSLDSDFLVDVDGDGLADVLTISASNGLVSVHRHQGVIPDLLTTATDGFGNYVNFSYAALSNANSYRYFNAVFPYQDYSGPISVVTNVTQSDGIGGTYNVSGFYYEGALINRQGRGFAGFLYRSWLDSRDNTAQRRSYWRAFPYTGIVSNARRTVEPSGNAVTEDQFGASHITLGSGYETRYFPYYTQNTHTDRDPSYGFVSTRIVTETTNVIDSTSGVPTSVSKVVSEPSGANGLSTGQTWTEVVTTTLNNDTNNWCLGVPAYVSVESSHTGYGGTQQTRTTSASWNTAKCRPDATTIQPGDPTWNVVNALEYDVFGNVKKTTVTGAGMTARTTTTIWTSDGRFPATTTNALAQTTTTAFSSVTGLPTSQTDPNGLTVLWLYDNFNRKTRENRPDGTASTWTYVSCPATYYCGDPLLRGYVQQSSLDTGGATISYQLLFFDIFERTKYDERSNLNGSLTNIHTIFDALGRTAAVSLPYFDTGGAAGYVTTTYDVLNRVTSVSRPISASNSTPQTTTNYYEGLKTRTVDPQGKQSWTISNANGQVVRAADHSQYHQQFDFDAFGNTVRVRDYYNTVMQTGTYNIRGMRTASTDVDMGSWSYTFNALGELTSQTDAKNQVTSMQYDALGREVLRTEPNAGGTITTAFTWGNSAAAKDIGRLTRADRYGTGITAYWETYGFDSLGRPSVTYVNTPGETHAINLTYNSSTGLMDSIMYPASTSGYRHQVVYEYQYGQLRKVRDIGNTVTYWLANNVDARGNITDESLGNGLRTTRGFDAVTGLPTFIRTGPGGGTATQNLNYGFDLVGNLTSRNDANQGLTESLTYDNLYRLTQSTVTGAPTLTMTYNAYGNIMSRSDVGSYTYHASKIHAVTAAGGFSYVYDANGNITTRNGSTVTWFANNKPQSIAGNGQTSTFEYGPSGQYWKQTATYSNGPETTLYIGGLLEKVTNSTLTSWRHHIKANGRTVAIYSRASTGATNTIYPLTDHLGSTDAITDSAGTVLVRESFTAFGARRGSNWQGTPTPADMTAIANATRRGYTDHTMLDNLGLVHMNGRVYDPAIGRFLSADPYVQFPLDTQSWNRYSYVVNNPLSFTDPSGYFLSGLKKFVKKWGGAIISVAFSMAGMPFVGALVSSAFSTAANGGNVGSFVRGFVIGAAAGMVAGPIAGRISTGIGMAGGSIGTQVFRGALSGGIAGGLTSEVYGGSFWSGFAGGAITGGITAGAMGMYRQHLLNSAIRSGQVSCNPCSSDAMGGLREFSQSPQGQRFLQGLRRTGETLSISESPSFNSAARFWFDSDAGNHTLGLPTDLAAYRNSGSGPLGNQYRSATIGNLIAHETGHYYPGGRFVQRNVIESVDSQGLTTFTVTMIRDPAEIVASVVENGHRLWMGSPLRSHYGFLRVPRQYCMDCTR